MIKKYRKKPVVIEAIRFYDQDEVLEKITAFMENSDRNVGVSYEDNSPKLKIETLEGDHFASEGDYIIKGVKGEFYPCKPDIFETTYGGVI